MPVIVDPGTMTYADLVAALEGYLNRTDYTARVPTFITMVEAKLNRLLDDPEMEQRAVLNGTAQYTTLPDDFKRLIGVTTGIGLPLKQVTGSEITSLSQTGTGEPRQFALVDGAITFAPVSTINQISILYTRRIPGLSASNPTNWLLDRAPDLYLYGALMQAHIYGWNDERVPGFKALFDEAVEEMRADASNRRWGGSPLRPSIART